MPLDDYSVSCSGGNIELAAGGPAAILALVDSFEKRLDSAKSAAIEANQLCCTGNAYDGLAKRHDGAELRVMTSNVLFTDSESFDTPYRMKCLMQTYLSYLPDIIGLQEARNTQLNALMPYLEGEYMAVPFTASDGGQVYQQILYLRDKYILVEYGFTRFRTKVIPWGVSWAVFRRISDGKLFAVTNTHNTIVANTYDPGLSNSVEGVQYRISNCKTVLETIDGIRAKHPSIPVFSTGDWNSTISAESLGPMMQSELMKDSMLTALAGADTITNSGHTIGQLPGRDGNIIDHIFVSADAVQVIYHDVIVNDTVINGSDHCPVYADAKFK
jgi:exonuclease III